LINRIQIFIVFFLTNQINIQVIKWGYERNWTYRTCISADIFRSTGIYGIGGEWQKFTSFAAPTVFYWWTL